jgi:zinc transport system substrate-binding protein
VLVATALPCCAASEPVSLVVTTSMLERAVHELGDAADGVDVVRLIPPGSCPGHFDLSPKSLPALRSATAIVRHQYQGFLEARLVEMGVDDAVVIVADPDGSLLIPDHYGRLVRRIGEIVGRLMPERGVRIDAAVAAVEDRLAGLELEIGARPTPWRGAQVISSFQQAQFSRWLGLEVVAEIGRPEDTSPRDFEDLLRKSPDLVVANLQEGLEAAATVADRLGVPLVVFSNFPGADGYGSDYDGLVTHNLDRLDAAWRKR